MTLENANLKKHCILQALLLVIIRFCPIYLLRYWPLFWVYLSTANWICLPHVFFFRPQRLKYPVYTVAGSFVSQKKCGKREKERWTLLPSSSFNIVAFSWIFLRLPLPPKKPLARQSFVLVSLRVVISFSLAKYIIALWLVRSTIVLDYSMHCVH